MLLSLGAFIFCVPEGVSCSYMSSVDGEGEKHTVLCEQGIEFGISLGNANLSMQLRSMAVFVENRVSLSKNTVWHRYYYYTHFVDEDSEAQRS